MEGSYSEWGNISSGVVQGSRIGPLLFSLYIQDLSLVLGKSPVQYRLFADDLKIYTRVSSPTDTSAIQNAINSISSWAARNNLAIAVHKCAAISSAGPDPSYHLDGIPIEVVSSFKDLGVTFDRDMKFRTHTANTARSAGQMCNLILRTFIVKNPQFYSALFNSLVTPRITYCSEIWRPFYAKDEKLIQSVLTRFSSRVANRCGIDRGSFPPPAIADIFQSVDDRVIRRLAKQRELEKFFVLLPTSTRSEVTISPPQLAKNYVVDHGFAWRTARRVTSDPGLRIIVSMYTLSLNTVNPFIAIKET